MVTWGLRRMFSICYHCYVSYKLRTLGLDPHLGAHPNIRGLNIARIRIQQDRAEQPDFFDSKNFLVDGYTITDVVRMFYEQENNGSEHLRESSADEPTQT